MSVYIQPTYEPTFYNNSVHRNLGKLNALFHLYPDEQKEQSGLYIHILDQGSGYLTINNNELVIERMHSQIPYRIACTLDKLTDYYRNYIKEIYEACLTFDLTFMIDPYDFGIGLGVKIEYSKMDVGYRDATKVIKFAKDRDSFIQFAEEYEYFPAYYQNMMKWLDENPKATTKDVIKKQIDYIVKYTDWELNNPFTGVTIIHQSNAYYKDEYNGEVTIIYKHQDKVHQMVVSRSCHVSETPEHELPFDLTELQILTAYDNRIGEIIKEMIVASDEKSGRNCLVDIYNAVKAYIDEHGINIEEDTIPF